MTRIEACDPPPSSRANCDPTEPNSRATVESSPEKMASKVMTIRVKVYLSPKQAARLEQFYKLFHIEKSALTEVALEEFFQSGQEEVMRKVRSLGRR